MGSQMLLLPDQRLGIFFAVNTRDIWAFDNSAYGVSESLLRPLFPRLQPRHIEPQPFSPGGPTAMSAYRRTGYRLPLRIKLETSSMASPARSALQAMARSLFPWKASSCALLKWSLTTSGR